MTTATDQSGRLGMATAQQIIEQQAAAGMDPDRIVQHHEDIAAMLRNEATTPEGRAFAENYEHTASALARELAEGDRAEPDMTDGTPHPEPSLADSGWHAQDGVYVRDPAPSPEPVPEPDAVPA